MEPAVRREAEVDNKIKQLGRDIGKSPKTNIAGSKFVSRKIPIPG